jgi:hypothetical protein
MKWRRLGIGRSGRATEERLQRIQARLDRIAKRTDRVEKATRLTAKDAELHVREVNRIGPQLAALEDKVEDLRQALEATPRIDSDDDVREAQTLIDLIRREHKQIRLRLSAVTTYEERLRRVEDRLGLPHD